MYLIAAAVLFSVFTANVMAGAFARQAFLDNTSAFLVLVATALCFVVAILRAEHNARLADRADDPDGP